MEFPTNADWYCQEIASLPQKPPGRKTGERVPSQPMQIDSSRNLPHKYEPVFRERRWSFHDPSLQVEPSRAESREPVINGRFLSCWIWTKCVVKLRSSICRQGKVNYHQIDCNPSCACQTRKQLPTKIINCKQNQSGIIPLVMLRWIIILHTRLAEIFLAQPCLQVGQLVYPYFVPGKMIMNNVKICSNKQIQRISWYGRCPLKRFVKGL